MKYSFRLFLTGQTKNANAQWGLPLNLQACPKCEALNHKTATVCVKCSHPLSDPVKPAENSIANTDPAVAPAASTEYGDFSQYRTAAIHKNISDDQKSAPSMALPASAAASEAAPTSDQATPQVPNVPNVPINDRRFVMSNKQKWQRRTWGAVFLAFFAIPIVIVVISLQPTPTVPSYPSKNPGVNTGNSEVIQPPVAPAGDMEIAATAPLTEPAAALELPHTEPQTPTPATQSAHTALARKAKSADRKIAQVARKPIRNTVKKVAPAALETPEVPIPRHERPVAPANTPCSEAARALALCNANTN